MGNTGNGDIAYQNKDITSKVLAEHLKGKTFRVYGLDVPEVVHVLPTNIPTVKANALRLDNIFELSNGSAAIVDYESDYRKEDKVKYLNYLTGIANRYLTEKRPCPKLRMIVIYTGDMKREEVAQIFEEEKQQALSQVVIKMIKKDYSSEEIASIVSGFSQEEVEAKHGYFSHCSRR